MAKQILFEKPDLSMYNYQVYDSVRRSISSLGGDLNTVNDFLFENYNHCTYYYDEDLSKTAEFLDTLSDNYHLRNEGFRKGIVSDEFVYLPSYFFKKNLADK